MKKSELRKIIREELAILNDVEFKPNIKVMTIMGTKRTGKIIKNFHWKDSTDGTYAAPGKNDIPVLWDDGTKGFHSKKYLKIIK